MHHLQHNALGGRRPVHGGKHIAKDDTNTLATQYPERWHEEHLLLPIQNQPTQFPGLDCHAHLLGPGRKQCKLAAACSATVAYTHVITCE